MSMPDKPAHEWESPASRKASANGEVGQPPIPPDGNGPAPGETHPQEGENAPRICGFDWESLASGEIPPQYSQNVPGINGVDWGSLASDTTPRDEETEQRSRSPDRIGPVPDRTSSTDQSPSCRDSSSDRIEPVPDRISSHDESASYRGMPSVRKDPASRRPSPQGEGAGNLIRQLLTAYRLLPLSIIALVALHYFPASSPPRYALEIGHSCEALRTAAVFVCVSPSAIPALLGLWRARRENNTGAAAHARALLLSLLYCVNACLLWLSSVKIDPGPAGPVESAGFLQVLEFIIELPARLFSWLFFWSAILLGCNILVRFFKGYNALRAQSSPDPSMRGSIPSFLLAAVTIVWLTFLLWNV